MLDPLNADTALIGVDAVLDGARRYIHARGDPPKGRKWGPIHIAKIESKVNKLLGQARQ